MSYRYLITPIIVLVTITLKVAPPIRAYGYAKCVLTFRNRGYADCIGQAVVNLTESIQHLPNQTLWLNVSQNDITVVERKAFSHLPNLLELRLNRNKISTIQPGALYNLNYLYSLDLSHNLIQSLQNVDLNDLTSLQMLNLSNNKLSKIENVHFKPLNILQELDLSFNHISDFRSVGEAVEHLNYLYTLNVGFNAVADLRSNQTMLVLSSLNILNLTNNFISVLDLSQLYMPNLTGLDVVNNSLSSINGSSFINIPNLSDIIFDENHLNISALLGMNSPNLTKLHWSSMRPALMTRDLHIACKVFQSFPKLKMLDIKHSKIPDKNLYIIGNCTNLTSLILSLSSLRNLVRKELQAFKSLEVLYLDKCKIRTIYNTTWIGLEALHTLILQRNPLTNLPRFLFSPLIHLRYLDLSKTHLTYINKEAFQNLTNLHYLSLSNCKIPIITKDSFYYLNNLRYLDMRDNSLSVVKRLTFQRMRYLETLLLSGNKIHSIQQYGLRGLKSLETLCLSNNFIYKFTDRAFTDVKSIVHLNISRNQLSFHGNKSPFRKLKKLETLDLSYQDPRYKESVPETLFEGLSSLQKLNIKGIAVSLFKNALFSNLTNLTDLDLSEIFQESDQHTTEEFIGKLYQIRYLILDNNNIKDLSKDTFANLKFLEDLSLQNNKLRNISQSLLKPLTNLSYLDARWNPLSCSCENYWFQNWSQFNNKVQVPFIQSYSCFAQVAYDINFVNQDLSFCGTDISVFFFFGSFSLTLLFMVTSLVAMKLKWSIHYLYYMARAWCRWNPEKEDKFYKYDAYISYCSDDEEWVMNELLFHLEREGRKKYKICFKPRDFSPGVYHIDNIQDAINNSRKTLCVISTNYLESQWCRLEIEMASSKVFYQKKDVLLVVFLENIPDYRLSAYHKLRKLIKQNTYINLPEDPQGLELFWFKLRKALGKGVFEEEALQLSVAN